MAVVLEWVVVISLGTCTQRLILIKFKGSFKFSLEHLGCLWHLIPLWKSTKRWPRMSPKKILVRVSIIFLTQHIVQLGSGVLTCWTFVFWNTFVTMVTSKVKTQFWSNQGEIFFNFIYDVVNAFFQSYCLVRKCWFLPQQENQLLSISSKWQQPIC